MPRMVLILTWPFSSFWSCQTRTPPGAVGRRATAAADGACRYVQTVRRSLPAGQQTVAGDLRAQPLLGSHPLGWPDGAGRSLCGSAGALLAGQTGGGASTSRRPGSNDAAFRALSWGAGSQALRGHPRRRGAAAARTLPDLAPAAHGAGP